MFINRFLKRFVSPEKYARLIGVNMGKNNFIADKNIWSAAEPYLITIGNNCQITYGVRIFTHGGGQVVRRQIPDFDAFGRVIIGNFVYIGNNSLIMPGVKIEDGALIAAGSVVTKSIPPKVVVGGNPAKIICTIDEYIQRNLKYNTHSKGLNYDKKKELLEQLPNNLFITKGYMK